MKKYFILLLIICWTLQNARAQTKEEKKLEKQEKKLQKQKVGDEQYANMKALIDSKNYIFEANRATATGAGGISMATNPNKILVDQAEVDIDMPYFGVIRSGGGYNNESGIRYKGIPDKYEVSHVEKKRQIIVRIIFTNSTETHNVKLTIGKEGQTNVLIISSGRNNITYSGMVTTIAQKGFH
ncbi:DUF4251 domain-containing protein [Eudoraea chungangensis]|uniref:DUF4251 domain-containing protein n=1 Tax=Eudoraea chungangensis TaxID=1481905 RepID=UPI0023EBA2A4|nr:DUF4251 domain-containing protein [Eudoraea chungangensis]